MSKDEFGILQLTFHEPMKSLKLLSSTIVLDGISFGITSASINSSITRTLVHS